LLGIVSLLIVAGVVSYSTFLGLTEGTRSEAPDQHTTRAAVASEGVTAERCLLQDGWRELETDGHDSRTSVGDDMDRCWDAIDALQEEVAHEQPLLAHTAVWRPNNIDKETFDRMLDKVRTMILSFLVTQKDDAILRFWVRNPTDIKDMKQWLDLDSMAKTHVHRVDFRSFSDIERSTGVAKRIDIDRFLKVYEDSKLPRALDVARYMMLDAHGGIWLDADTLVLRDMSPLAGLSFAYTNDWASDPMWSMMNITSAKWLHGQMVNNAVIGVDSNQSCFTQALLSEIAEKQKQGSGGYFEFGPALISQLPDQRFHPLPGCFFEPPSGWPPCSEVFKATDKSEENAKLLRSGKGPFTYHWHNRWEEEVESGSAFALHTKYLETELR
jgi:hypothetical protein